MSASMLCIDAEVGDGHMRCAKRSSAALRTAVALEDAADAAAVEMRDVHPKVALPADLRPASVMSAFHSQNGQPDAAAVASEVAKLRRDIKNCYEQHPKAIACGDVPLVRVPILGRAIRIFDEWHALCAFCGCLARIHPTSRFRADPCCMRCDFAMLHGKEAAQAMQALLPKPPAPSCRYCGRRANEHADARRATTTTTSLLRRAAGASPRAPPRAGRWSPRPRTRAAATRPCRRRCASCTTARVRARLHPPPPYPRTSHPSFPSMHFAAHLSPPPRRAAVHWRSWLANAHKEIPTNIIFAHILQKARPMFGADRRESVASNGRCARTIVTTADGGEGEGEAGAPAPAAKARKRSASRSAIGRKLSAQGGGARRPRGGRAAAASGGGGA